MALIYPFDETLNGHVEIMDVDTSELTYPIITFPKGSFFVDETFIKIKGTNQLLRPGIDYRVMSCNENIPFSNDPDINNLLKQNYVRNAILLRGISYGTLECHVAYCGGEEDFKPAEYANLLNTLYTDALMGSTVTNFKTPHQGWGNFLSADNTQITQGKFIYSKEFEYAKEMANGGLGWGKVELALIGIADTVTQGSDPLTIQAFYKWVEHNITLVTNELDNLEANTNVQIDNLGSKRVSIEQFIFSDLGTTPIDQTFIEHKNVILRGLDPNLDGVGTIHALGSGSSGGSLKATILKQRKDSGFMDQRDTIKVSLDLATNAYNDPNLIMVDCTVISEHPIKSNRPMTLVVMSSELKNPIFYQPIDVTTNATLVVSVPYARNITTAKSDVLFAYVVNEFGLSDFSGVDELLLDLQNSSGYTIEVNSFNSLTGSGNLSNSSVTLKTTLGRSPNLPSEVIKLQLRDANGLEVGFVNNTLEPTTNITTNWASGETSKIIPNLNIKLTAEDKGLVYLTMVKDDLAIASMPLFIKGSDELNFAILLTNIDGTPSNTGDYLSIGISKDITDQATMQTIMNSFTYTIDNGIATKLQTNNAFNPPNKPNTYLVPLNFSTVPKGKIITIQSSITNTTLNFLSEGAGGLSQTAPINATNITPSVAAIYSLNGQLRVKVRFTNYNDLTTINQAYGLLRASIFGKDYFIEFRPGMPYSNIVDVELPTVGGFHVLILSHATMDAPVGLTLPNHCLLVRTRNGDEYYNFSYESLEVAKFKDEEIRISFVNLTDLNHTVFNRSLGGKYEFFESPARSSIFITDWFVPNDITMSSSIVVKVANTGENGITYNFNGTDAAPINHAVVKNVLTDRATFRYNQINHFNMWLKLPTNVNVEDIISYSVSGTGSATLVSDVDGMVELAVSVPHASPTLSVVVNYLNGMYQPSRYVANLIEL